MKYITRFRIRKDGKIEEVKVPEKVAARQISELLKKDKEMLKVLEKL